MSAPRRRHRPLPPRRKACPELQPWLSQTQDALSQAQALGTEAGVGNDLAALDADAVGQAAAEVATLGQTQRGLEAPEEAVAANRLVVTALSTYARGLQVAGANAATAQDADLLAQGQSVLADGDQLLQRRQRRSAPWPAPVPGMATPPAGTAYVLLPGANSRLSNLCDQWRTPRCHGDRPVTHDLCLPRRRQWTVVSRKVSAEDNRGGCLEGHGMPCPDKDNAAACRVFTSC